MTFKNLTELISKEYSLEIISHGEDSEILDVALIDEKHDTTDKNILYFGYDKQLENIESIPSQCILARTGHISLPAGYKGNIALVPETFLFTIFNDSKSLIESHTRGIFEELSALANKTRSIEAVIDTASVRLGNSLIFCDMNFKIIACSTTIPVLDPLWLENTKQGYCCYEFISEIKELKAIQNASQTTAAVEVTCPRSPYRKLSSKVFHNQRQIGFLLVIEAENSILPSHFEMLSTISNVVSYTIAYYSPYLFEETNLYQETLYDMLIGAPSSDIMPRLKKLHFPPLMLVLFIRPTVYLGQQYLINFTCKNLKVAIPDVYATYHNNGIVAVIPAMNDKCKDEGFLNLLKELCQKEHLRIGISNSFTNIGNFVSYYKQAHTALEISHRLRIDEPVSYYQDYQVYDLFSEINNPDNLGRFCHPALTTLRQHDHKNSSELYKTLCVFIDKGCNIKLTSESLYIHRNSLVYRLNRITKICQLDFTDINTVFLLRLSFLIDRYNELNTNTEWL